MSAEHQPGAGAERHEQAHQELEAARREQLEQLRAQPEIESDTAERRAEAAREVIDKSESESGPIAQPEAAQPKAPQLAFLNHHLNYVQTLGQLQRRLSPVSRQFSRIIHTPAVERASEALEHTVARPSIAAGSTWTALIVGGLFYFTARRYGYNLSGSEMLFSFLVGAALGLLLEAGWRAFKHR